MKHQSGSTCKSEASFLEKMNGSTIQLSNTELKNLLIDQICEEIDLSDPIQVEFYAWLIWALGLQNN